MKEKNYRWQVLCNSDLSLKEDALRELENIADVSYFPARQEILLEKIASYDAYFASTNVEVNETILNRAEKLKVIAVPGTGTDHINILESKKRGITVLHIANELDLLNEFTATAELAWALLLGCLRKLPSAFDCAKYGYWARERFVGYQLHRKTLGIVGIGRLGTMVARYGNAFGMRVLGYDIEAKNVDGVQQIELDELLRESDAISMHIHLTERTRGFLSEEEFRKMKSGVVIVNTSRGGVINESALLNHLESGKVSAAGLDVIDGEWSNIYDHPLVEYSRKHANLIITPHIGGATVESIVGAREFMAKKLASYIQKQTTL